MKIGTKFNINDKVRYHDYKGRPRVGTIEKIHIEVTSPELISISYDIIGVDGVLDSDVRQCSIVKVV